MVRWDNASKIALGTDEKQSAGAETNCHGLPGCFQSRKNFPANRDSPVRALNDRKIYKRNRFAAESPTKLPLSFAPAASTTIARKKSFGVKRYQQKIASWFFLAIVIKSRTSLSYNNLS